MSFKKIIQIEFIKLQRPANFVLLGLMLLIYISISAIYFYNFQTEQSGSDIKNVLLKNLIQMESGFISFFIVIFIIMNVGKEYSDNTLRKNIIDGYAREQFFTGKLLVLLICVSLVLLLGKITMLTGGLAIGHYEETLQFLTPSVLINSFMKLLSTGIFALFLIFLTRNITISIIFYFLWSSVESIAGFVLAKVFNIENIQSYLPISSMNSVLTENQIIHTPTIIIATLYLFVMLFTSYYLLLKRDIK